MTDYVELSIDIDGPEFWGDVIAGELAEISYESFEQENGRLKAYVPSDLFEEDAVKSLLQGFETEFSATYSTKVIKAKNWNAEWEANFKPVVIDDQVYVRAPFHEDRPDIRIEILLTPKMSFGTGHHATTSMVMREMLQLDFSNTRVFDIGCGTAILAILSEKLGCAKAFGIDNDEWAVVNSQENIEINNCHKISVEKGTVGDLARSTYNVILANINRNVILQDLSTYVGFLAEKGHILLSGFRFDDLEMVRNEAKKCGLTEVSADQQGEWCMLHFER